MNNKAKSSWQDLPLRIASAVVIIPLALLCIIYGGALYIGLLFLVSIAMTYEWATLFKANFKRFPVILFLIWPIVAYCAAIKGMWWPGIVIACIFSFILGRQLWLGSVVIGGAGIALLWLRFMTVSEMWAVIYLISVVIASDSFAYIVGKLLGGPKLIPSVSPGKTWSGAIGGLIGAGMVGGYIIFYFSGEGYTAFIGGALFSMVTGIVAQIGDLLESKLKRELGVKDSGKIIPGHGGVLDRFDALLLVSVFVALISWSLPKNDNLQKWGGGLLLSKNKIGADKPSYIPLTIFRY
ncbi:phosphatidate cytidylyltransferase [Commensalibacter oyaizuii]|uniref:Phosphatidate cytidylyltransferase n=1 Tax=Commensalibacter oyaizuii TaxID=3043873 RepID=A0ABT6PZ09_9PROT|nr:phosphatidate cytidylyltransferase [Commensalibacter sp. TBRC 16381]MDI2090069.1 phosphatidate cytidylyltransferase [Commensalibacter sp. TBRC 16381]